MSWKGTAIPNDGTTVEKLYVNTNLSIEETVALLDKLTYIQVDSENEGYYAFWYDAEDVIAIGVAKNNGKYTIGIDKNGVQTPLFIQDSGWQEFENPIDINYGTGDEMLGIPVGRENEEISSILSITPFEEVQDNIPYFKWEGTPVPNSGTIEKVYFNTKLSTDEIKALIDSLTFSAIDLDDRKVYVVAGSSSENYQKSISIGKIRENTNEEFVYVIEHTDNDDALITTTIWDSVNGWALDNIAFSGNLINEDDGIPAGDQNDKLSSLISATPFKKVPYVPTLNEWSEDIADAIREKKGIENIVEYSGTPVPNSGSIGNIYQNGRASVEETKKIFASLTYEQEGPNYYRYWVCKKQESNYALGVYIVKEIYEGKEEYYVGYRTASNSDGISFMSSYYYKQLFGIDFEGWSATGGTDLEPLEFSFVCDEGYGLENDKLSSLISITPFEETEIKTLIPRLNFAQEIRSIETGGEILEPTAVPISGMVEKVYFNFNVDVSKMVEVIKNLSFIDAGLGVPVYPIISNIAGTDGLLFVKIDDNFYYLQRGETHLIASISISGTEPEYEIKIIDNRDDSNFYKNDFTKPMEFGFVNAVELATASLPDYVNSNELLKEMISITPIQKIEGTDTSDATATASDILQGKTAYANGEKVEGTIESYNGENEDGVVELSSGTAVPISGMVEKVYFNFNVDVVKMCNIVSGLTFLTVPGIGEVYPIISNADMSSGLVLQKVENGHFSLIFQFNGQGNAIAGFIDYDDSVDPTEMIHLVDDNDFTQPLEFGFENMVSQLVTQFPTYVNNNELLKEMISITPIQKIENVSAIVGYKGTAVPDSENISSLYLNTDLTIEEIKALIDNVEMVSTASDGSSVEYDILYNSTVNGTFAIRKDGLNTDNVEYQIGFQAGAAIVWLWNSTDGWLEEGINLFNEGLISNLPLLNELEQAPAFNYYQNDKLSPLLSITPFEVVNTEEFVEKCSTAVLEAKGEGTSWKGIAVPSSGTIESVYINTNLSVEEVNALLSQLTYTSDATDSWYQVVINGVAYILIYKISDDEYGIINAATNTIYYNNGWQSFTNPVQINVENQTEFTENDKLSSLFSTTPFTKNSIYPTLIPDEIRKLSVGGEGIEDIIKVEELPEPFGANAVPNSGIVEKVYFNTNLSIDEVVNILQKLVLTSDGAYLALYNEPSSGLPVQIVIGNLADTWLIAGTNLQPLYFASKPLEDLGITNAGWQTFDNPYNFNVEATSTNGSVEVGTQNDKISSLISTTPFELNSDFDASKIYYLNQKMGDIYAYMGSWGSIKDEVDAIGGKVYPIVVKDKPTENIKESDLNNMIMYGYFVENENDIFLYADWAGDGNPSWLSFSEAMFNGEATYGGQITDISEATDPTKYYTVAVQTFYKYSNGWVEYKYGGIVPTIEMYDEIQAPTTITYDDISTWKSLEINVTVPDNYVIPDGAITITENGSYDVKDFLEADVDILVSDTFLENTYSNINVPNSVSSIGAYKFSSNNNLTTVTLPNGLRYLQDGLFFKCGYLTSVTIPDGVIDIGEYSFKECTSLTSITIPDAVTDIGVEAFKGCTSLTSVHIGKSLSNFRTLTIEGSSDGIKAFAECSELSNITVDAANSTYDSRNNCNAIIKTSSNSLEVGCKNTIIPDNVKYISANAFYGSNIESIVIPISVKQIGKEAFHHCFKLSNIVFENGLTSITSIGSKAFYYCYGLTSIVIPDSVTSIGEKAFKGCQKLTSITLSNNLKFISESSFEFCSKLPTIVIPDSVEFFERYAFSQCYLLDNIVIGTGLKSIGIGVFSLCNSLKNVYYKGTEEQWNNIYIASGNDALTNATIHYNYVEE